jgi:hypothetical protein
MQTRSDSGEINTLGSETSDLARLKQLENESRRKDRIIARLTMEVDAVRELISKNGWGSHSDEKR